MIHTDADNITMLEIGANYLDIIYECAMFAAPVTDEQLIPQLCKIRMITGDPRIFNHNVVLRSTANKPSISILESVLPHGEVLVFQFKSKQYAPVINIIGLRSYKCKLYTHLLK